MEWSNEMTVEFLTLFEKEPLIWNPKDPNHKNRNLVNDAWNRIKDHLSVPCSVADLKKKKDSLMATFRPLSHKVKGSMKTGSGTNDVYKPNWIFYEQMAKFLHSVYQPKTTINTEELDDTFNLEETNTEDEIMSLESPSQEVFFKSPASKVTKKRKNNDVIEDCMMDAYKIMKNVCEKPARDDCSVYTELLARKLRTFDEPTREVLMHDIDELVFRAKRRTLSRDVQSYLPPIQLRQNYPSAFNTTPYYFNNAMPQFYSNTPLSLNTSPRFSSSLSSENVPIHQPSISPSTTNLSYQSPETCFEPVSLFPQNQNTEGDQFL